MLKEFNLNTMLVIVGMIGALYVYLEGNSNHSFVLASTIQVLRGDLDDLEGNLSNVPTSLVRIEERIKSMQKDIDDLKGK